MADAVTCPSLFPLPLLPSEQSPSKRLSRGTQQRISARKFLYHCSNDAIRGLNWLNGNGFDGGACDSPSLVQREVQQDVLDAASDLLHFDRVDPHEAAKALLGTRAGYSMDTGPVQSFKAGLVSLPQDVISALVRRISWERPSEIC